MTVNEQRWNLLNAMRAGNYVKRFHTEILVKEETVGMHTAGVLGIITAMYYPNFPRAELLVYALLHDVGEKWVGDTPAQVKWEHPELASALNHAEEKEWAQRNVQIPKSISDEERALCKFADSMDALFKCAEEFAFGNIMVRGVYARLVEFITGIIGRLPEEHRVFASIMFESAQRATAVTMGEDSE